MPTLKPKLNICSHTNDNLGRKKHPHAHKILKRRPSLFALTLVRVTNLPAFLSRRELQQFSAKASRYAAPATTSQRMKKKKQKKKKIKREKKTVKATPTSCLNSLITSQSNATDNLVLEDSSAIFLRG